MAIAGGKGEVASLGATLVVDDLYERTSLT